MSEQSQATPLAEPPRRRRLDVMNEFFARWYRRFHHPDGPKRYRRYAHAYAIAVAIGVPLMTLCIDDFYLKLAIAALWCGIVPTRLFWLEGNEIVAQIRKYGLLDQEESDYQRKAMMWPYYGVIFAFVLWLIVLIGYIVVDWSQAGFVAHVQYIALSVFHTPLRYGFIEWGILVQTLWVTYHCIDINYPLISDFLQATAGQRRIEEGTMTVAPARH
jgi:hypothetical protein